jgi:release factor glutamine methyltransferase
MSVNSLPPALAIKDWLDEATAELTAAAIPTARLDAELILSHTLRMNRTALHAHPDTVLTDRQEDIANARLALRLDRVPVAYIIGHKEFYGRHFAVTSATLIPRPESESLIELLKRAVPQNTSLLPDQPLKLVDVGTGSGILGITAKLLYPELEVALLDKSRQALVVAAKNVSAHHVEATTLQSDLLSMYPFTADIIIANLPYVDPTWERSPETEHEPADALFAAQGGLSLIYKLILQTREQLSLGGSLILEADPEQHPSIIEAAKQSGLILKDSDGYGMLFEKLK